MFMDKTNKVEVLWEGHNILRNHHFRFDVYYNTVKSKLEISQNFVGFSEYLNFKKVDFLYILASIIKS